MPRKSCSPSEISLVVASCRSAVPILPEHLRRVSRLVRWLVSHAARAALTALSAASQAAEGRPVPDRENRKHPVADEFEHLAAEGVNGTGDPIKPGVERRDHRLRRRRLRQSGEPTQIAIEQRPRGWSRLSVVAAARPAPAPRCVGRDRPRAAPRGSIAWQVRPAVLRRNAPPDAPARIPVRSSGRDTDQLSTGPSDAKPGTSSRTTAPPKPVSQSHAEIALSWPCRTKGPEAQRLDHRSGLRSPQPCAAGDHRVWRRQHQGPAGERQAVGDQLRAKRGQEMVSAGRGTGLVDKPSEGGGQPHEGIMRLLRGPVTAVFSRKWHRKEGRQELAFTRSDAKLCAMPIRPVAAGAEAEGMFSNKRPRRCIAPALSLKEALDD